MAKKKEDPQVPEKEELVPVLLPNGCIGHWVKKEK